LGKGVVEEPAISGFFGEYRFLSNFWPVEVQFDGEIYPSVEHGYQAAKCLELSARDEIRRAARPGKAKKLGGRGQVRPDWEQIRVEVMRELVRQKFVSHRDLAEMLLATENAELVEENTWGDTFWGVCDGAGENRLGRILMDVREEIRLEGL
jgi:ribA/ribD-fused uncharacterized protein